MACAKGGGRFDQDNFGCSVKASHAACGAQDVGHERATARAKLCEREGGRRTHIEPALGETEAYQLPKHLADFGRCCEVTTRTEGVTGCVIAMLWMLKAERHELSECQGTTGADERGDMVLKWAHAMRWRLDQRIMSTPTKTIGSERSWPMVSPRTT